LVGTHYEAEAMDWSPSGPSTSSYSALTAAPPPPATGAPFLFYTKGSTLPPAQPPTPAHPSEQFHWDPNAFGVASKPSFEVRNDRNDVSEAHTTQERPGTLDVADEPKETETALVRREIATGAVNRERRRRQQKGSRRRRSSFAADVDDDDEESSKLEARRQLHQHFTMNAYNYPEPTAMVQRSGHGNVWWKGDTPYIIAG
jgi:hypothetical protein